MHGTISRQPGLFASHSRERMRGITGPVYRAIRGGTNLAGADDKMIAVFGKDNGPAIRKVSARFVELCRNLGLLTKASVAIDGSKFKVVEQSRQELHPRESRAAPGAALRLRKPGLQRAK